MTLKQAIRQHYGTLEGKRRILYGFSTPERHCTICLTYPKMSPTPQPLYTWIDNPEPVKRTISGMTLTQQKLILQRLAMKEDVVKIRYASAEFPTKGDHVGNTFLRSNFLWYRPYHWQVGKGEAAQNKDLINWLQDYLFPDSFKHEQQDPAAKGALILQPWGKRNVLELGTITHNYTGIPDAYCHVGDHVFLIVDFIMPNPSPVFRQPQSVAYLLAASIDSLVPVLVLATDLIANWYLYWITGPPNERPYVVEYSSVDTPDPRLTCWLARQAALASLKYWEAEVTGLCMAPDPGYRREDTDEEKDKYRWRGFRRQIPSLPAPPPTSGNSAAGDSSVGEQAEDGSEPGDNSDPLHDEVVDEVVEEVERVVVAEHDFEGTREEYNKEKSFLINTTYYNRIYEYTATHPGGKIEDLLRQMIKEEEIEDDIKSSRLAEDEKLGIERVNLFTERASTEHNIQPCG